MLGFQFVILRYRFLTFACMIPLRALFENITFERDQLQKFPLTVSDHVVHHGLLQVFAFRCVLYSLYTHRWLHHTPRLPSGYLLAQIET